MHMGKTKKYKVIVVDDYRISREFLEMLVRGDAHYKLTESFSDADAALEYCRSNEDEVDLVLMDRSSLPG